MAMWERLCCPFCCLQERNRCGKGHFNSWHVVGLLVWPIWSLLEVLTVFICLFSSDAHMVRAGNGAEKALHKLLHGPALHWAVCSPCTNLFLLELLAHISVSLISHSLLPTLDMGQETLLGKTEVCEKENPLNLSCDYFGGPLGMTFTRFSEKLKLETRHKDRIGLLMNTEYCKSFN